MANIENLRHFNKENAKAMGRKGGIASGKTRRRKAFLKRRLKAMIELSMYFDTLSKEEVNEFISEYTPEQQEYIRKLFYIINRE